LARNIGQGLCMRGVPTGTAFICPGHQEGT